jgi:multiple sugar transport system permease protein
MRAISLNEHQRRRRFIYAVIIPAVLLELLIHIIPMVLGALVSIKAVNINTLANWLNAPFVGFKNYITILKPGSVSAKQFWASAGTTLKYGVIAKFFHFGLGLWGALILNRDFKGRGIFRTIFMIPYAVPIFISGISWRFMFQKEWGLINYILVDKLHLLAEKPFWLVGDNALWAIVTAQVWRGWSFHFIMILAGLQTVPIDLYEAVEIDGGNSWHKFRHVTFVSLKPVLTTLLVVNGMKILNEFETTYVMLSERPPASANVMSVNIFDQAFNNWNFGLASANSLLWVLTIIAISIFLMKVLMPKEDKI